MELIILDHRLQEVSRFNSFDSLVWNERYQTPGDFQMLTYGIETTLQYLWKGQLVSVDNSDFVMQVTNMDFDVDSGGNELITVTGKTLESIFAYRPALKKIASLSTLEAEGPWEFGDMEGDRALLDPRDVLHQVVRHVDENHYGRDILSHLSLPFTYHEYVDYFGDSRPSESRFLINYSIDIASTVEDVFAELLPRAQMGIATLKPNVNSVTGREHVTKSTPDRPGMFVFYRPRMVEPNPVSFDYIYEDYTSESVQTSTDHPNTILQAEEDFVWYSGDGSGLTAKVVFRERERLTLDDVETQERNYRLELGEYMFEQYSQLQNYSLETSGTFPYDQKLYKFGDNSKDAYFLGDIVRLNTKSEGVAEVQIMEYIRTQDSNGYREYPTFQLFKILGNNETGRVNKTIANYAGLATRHDWN